jgi:signal peptidase I
VTRAWRVTAITGAAGAAAALVVVRRATIVVTIRGGSMRPTYEPGDRVLVLRRRADRGPRVGDVVLVRAPAAGWTADDEFTNATMLLVKRVARVADDGGLFVVGDAAGGPDGHDSYDSRSFGVMDQRAVLGRVVARLPDGPRRAHPVDAAARLRVLADHRR